MFHYREACQLPARGSSVGLVNPEVVSQQRLLLVILARASSHPVLHIDKSL